MPKKQLDQTNLLKNSQLSLEQDQWEKSINFVELEKRVFSQKGTNIYIGGELVSDTIRGILRDQAKSFSTTNLYDILDATITNEAANLALIQSANFDHVQYAKALHHWNHVLKNMINALSK
jgi:hypothetical protein